MDILVSSNLERQLWELTHDAEAVRGWMADLAGSGRFQVDRATFAAMREVFAADWVTNEESLDVIRGAWHDHGYLLDPHTAVAWEVAERLRGENPVVVVATAHWAKFGADVYKALAGIDYTLPLPMDAARLTGVELLGRISEMAPDAAPVPRGLAELDSLPDRFDDVAAAGRAGVETAIREWLE
jgi:threonine synthase